MDKKTIEVLKADAESKWETAANAQERVLYACVAHFLESKLEDIETAPKYAVYTRTNGPDRMMKRN